MTISNVPSIVETMYIVRMLCRAIPKTPHASLMISKNATAGQHALIQIHRPSSLFAPKPDWTAARGPHQAGLMVVRLFHRMR